MTSSAPTTGKAPQTQPVLLDPSLGREPDAGKAKVRKSEVVGFIVKGRRMDERLAVEDLDSIVIPDNVRLLPIMRLLRAFNVQITEEADQLIFEPEGVGKVVIDLKKNELQIKGKTRPITYVEATSEVTFKRDIYLAPELVSEILGMELEWDAALYEYRVQLDRTLSIWKQKKTASLFSIRALYVPADIPELLPPASISGALVHFVEGEWNPRYIWKPGLPKGSATSIISLSEPRETIWGNLAGGRYKLRLSEPAAQWENTPRHWSWVEDRPPAVRLNWAEWVYRFETSELALGDSPFGIGELIFPSSQITGIRFNGLTGFTKEQLESDRSSLGFRNYFSKPYVFDGYAPIGSTVELLLNDRVIDSQEVAADKTSPPGMGVYRFEDVRLPSGILNEVVIRITEPNGNQSRVDKAIMGSPLLLPKGKSSYMVLAGSRRDLSIRTYDNFEVGETTGPITAARVLYGVDDRLTLGGMFGYEQDEFLHYQMGSTIPGRRMYPLSSTHGGGLFSWLPFDKLLLSGDVAGSWGEGRDSYDDTAIRMRGELLPTDNFSLNADFFNIGPAYFDGENIAINDRRAGSLAGRWTPHRKWTLEYAVGALRDNLDDNPGDTLRADYETLRVQTSVIPKTNLTARISHLRLNWATWPRTQAEIRLFSTPLPGLDLYGQVSGGDDLSLPGHSDFFSGFKLPGLPDFNRPRVTGTVRKSLPYGNSVGLTYMSTKYDQSASLSHDLTVQLDHPLRTRTELFRDLFTAVEKEKYHFRHLTEYFLDDLGHNRIGFQAECRERQWELTVSLSIKDFCSVHDGRFIRPDSRQIRPDYGAVHGTVFVDYNANVKRDPGEPGLPDVKVRLGDLYTSVTDKEGYYILPALSDSKKVRVFLDLDTVPANFSALHCTQLAEVATGSLTVVDLCVTPFISIRGLVVVVEADNTVRPIIGVRVVLSDPKTGKFVADSISAEDGSYYLGNIKPGTYGLQVDMQSLPRKYTLAEPKRQLEVAPGKDYQELKVPDFTATPVPPAPTP